MHRRNTALLSIAFGCSLLGGATAAGASGLPTLAGLPADPAGDNRPAFMHQFISGGLAGDRNEEFRFRHFADLFLNDDVQDAPGGIALNVTAAIFGQRERRKGGFVFGSGGEGARGGAEALPRLDALNVGLTGAATAAGPVVADGPGGGSGFSGGGSGGSGTGGPGSSPGHQQGGNDGGGGGGFAGGGASTGADASGPSANENENDTGSLLAFADNSPHDHDCCCCCGDFNAGFMHVKPTRNHNGLNSGSSHGDDGGQVASIPLPATLWIGLMGLAAVGWIRQRRLM